MHHSCQMFAGLEVPCINHQFSYRDRPTRHLLASCEPSYRLRWIFWMAGEAAAWPGAGARGQGGGASWAVVVCESGARRCSTRELKAIRRLWEHIEAYITVGSVPRGSSGSTSIARLPGFTLNWLGKALGQPRAWIAKPTMHAGSPWDWHMCIINRKRVKPSGKL